VTELPDKGDLRDYNLAVILIALKRAKATGTLTVISPGFTKNIYIKEGNAVFASSSLEDDRLGEMLMKAGKITIQQYEKSVQILKSTGRRQGAILVELGYITPKDLFWGVKYQVKEVICSLFRVEEGAYEFREGPLASDEVITLKISMENLIYEGMKRLDTWTGIKKEIPHPEIVFEREGAYSGSGAAELTLIDLNSEDRLIFTLIDGERTVGQLIDETGLNSFEVMKTLSILSSVGVIRKKESTISPAADRELRERVEEFYKGLKDMGPDEILQVDRNAGDEEMKRNYYRLVREFHPDRVYHSGDSALREKISTLFDAITSAYRLLQDDTRRAEYFRSAEKGYRKESWMKDFSTEPSPEERKAMIRDEQFKRGVEEFKKGDFVTSAELFRWMAGDDPKDVKAWSYLSLALSKIPSKLKEAEEALLQAIRLDPFNSDHIANLGLIYLKAGLKTRAKQQFEKALRLDSGNARAKAGLEQTG